MSEIETEISFRMTRWRIVLILGTIGIIFLASIAGFVYFNQKFSGHLLVNAVIFSIVPAAILPATGFYLAKFPSEVRCTKESLRLSYRFRDNIAIPWEDIETIKILPIYIRATHHAAPGYTYPIEINHRGGKQVLQEIMIRDFGIKSEDLLAILKRYHQARQG